MRSAINFLILSTFIASAVAVAQVPLIPPSPAAGSPRVVQAVFAEAMALFRANYGARALRVAERFIDSETFSALPPEIQHPIIGLEATAWLLNEKHEEARAAFVKLSESDYATALDWIGRAESAERVGKLDEYAADLIVITERWPDVFADIPSGDFEELKRTTWSIDKGPVGSGVIRWARSHLTFGIAGPAKSDSKTGAAP